MKITAQKFSDQTGISKNLAKRILDLLYSNDYGAKAFDRILWRLRGMLEKKMIPDLMEKLTDDQIQSVIDEMEADDSQDCELAREYSEGQFGVWLFSELGSEFAEKTFKPGDSVDIQIMRTGQWNHQLYGKINVDQTVLKDVVKNFDSNERGIDLAVDENHEPNHKALAWYKKLYLKGKDALFATLELTKKGAELLNEGAYKYFSPEIVFQKKDEESGKVQKNLLIGGAFTNRPFFKAMQPLLASEDGQIVASNGHQTNHSTDTVSKSESYILAFNDSKIMNKFLQLIAQFADMTAINSDQKTQLEKAFNQIPENERTEEMQNAFNEVVSRFSEDGDDSEQAQANADAGEDKTDTASDKADEAASDKDNGDDSAADEAKADEPTTVSASENADGTVTIQASEFKTMQAQLAKMVREGRKNELEKKVEAMKFSESNKIGVVLPKNKNAVVEFALSLSEQQSEKFLKIIGDLQTVAASEIGHSHDNNKTVTTEKAEKIKFFTEKLGMTAEQAEQAFSDGASQ